MQTSNNHRAIEPSQGQPDGDANNETNRRWQVSDIKDGVADETDHHRRDGYEQKFKTPGTTLE